MCHNHFNKLALYPWFTQSHLSFLTQIHSSSSSSTMRNNDSPYTPLLNGPHNNNRKELLLIFCGLFLLASLIAFSGYKASDNVSVPHAHVSSSSSILSHEETKPNMVVSPSVSAGVSEKSNVFLSGANKVGETESFPWNNTMLSWQRTSFHFQPEKNWMNGNSMLLFFILFFPK